MTPAISQTAAQPHPVFIVAERPRYAFSRVAAEDDTAGIDGCRGANAVPTLGIEITIAAIAARCDLGNIDPQHGFGTGDAASAIEAAFSWPLPPNGARLVTIRPDADSLGAMAVLYLRSQGWRPDAQARDRVRLVGACDNFSMGGWERWRAMRGPLRRPAVAEDMLDLPLDYMALAACAGDERISIKDRVERIAAWLVTGRLPPGSLAAARAAGESLAWAWNGGLVRISAGADPRIALVESSAPGGLRLGYRMAPVVIATASSAGRRKVTIAQFDDGHVDLARVKSELGNHEPGWGGTATIIGSPQDHGCLLNLAVVEAAVAACLSGASEHGGQAAGHAAVVST